MVLNQNANRKQANWLLDKSWLVDFVLMVAGWCGDLLGLFFTASQWFLFDSKSCTFRMMVCFHY